MIAPDLARQQADVIAGATYDELRARSETAHRALEAWHATYHAALLTLPATPNANGHEPPPLTVLQAAEALSCGKTMVYELLARGRLRKVAGFGAITRIAHAEIQRFIATRDGED